MTEYKNTELYSNNDNEAHLGNTRYLLTSESTSKAHFLLHVARIKAPLVAAGVSWGVTKALARVQAPSVATAYASMGAYETTGSSPASILAAALAAGAVSLGWTRTATAATNATVNNYPGIQNTIRDRAPLYSNFYRDSLPGINDCTESGRTDFQKKSTAQRIGAHVTRGIVSIKRPTNYVSTAGRMGHSKSERSRLANTVSTDAAIATGVLFGGIAGVVSGVNTISPESAENIQQVVTHPGTWVVAGALPMAWNLAKNRFVNTNASQ